VLPRPADPPGPTSADLGDPVEVHDLDEQLLAGTALEEETSLGIDPDAPALAERRDRFGLKR
jgi:hypothetical protein